MSPLKKSVSELESAFSGRLIGPEHPDYDETRRVHNGLVDRRPTLIAQCRGTADVQNAVRLAREHDLLVAVRGGGHNVSGQSTVDDGLMIDLSEMKGMHVDPSARVARAQPGLTWDEFNRETQVHGLATTGGFVSTTGIAGLTLGGGVGWLMGLHGLALDNLLSAEIVTADGSILTASAEENPDLFWGIRGGGGNFGIATSFEYRLHPVGPTVTAGMVAWPFAQARDVLRFFRELVADSSDAFEAFLGLVTGPDGSKLIAIGAAQLDSSADGDEVMRPIKEFGDPVLDALGPMSYEASNTLLDESLPRGALNYWKSRFLTDLSDEAVDTLIDVYDRCQLPMSQVVLEHYHGEATRIAADATAFPHRHEGYNLVVVGQWTDPADTEAGIAWARSGYEAMTPYFDAGRYVNYLDDDEPDDAVAAAYGPNLPRLRQIKRAYDPDNFFRMNQNIPPEA